MEGRMTGYEGMTRIESVPAAIQEVKGRVIYLARERRSQRLVALQLHPGSSPSQMYLEVLRRLNSTLPSLEERCGFCQRVVPAGSKYCAKCGADLTVTPSGSSDEVLEAVKRATGAQYELLGRMEHGDRGGVVFIMRERSSGRLSALRLHKRDESASGRRVFDLDQTNVMGRVAQEVGAGYSGSPPDNRLLKAVQRTVGEEYEVLGELGRIAEREPDPIRVRPSVKIAASAGSFEPSPGPGPVVTPQRDTMMWLGLSGAALILLLVVALVWSRDQRTPTAPVVATPPPAEPIAIEDSATIEIGGSLPRNARVTIDRRRVGRGSHRVPVGVHHLRAEATGYATVSDSIEVEANDVVTWGPRMRRRAAPAQP